MAKRDDRHKLREAGVSYRDWSLIKITSFGFGGFDDCAKWLEDPLRPGRWVGNWTYSADENVEFIFRIEDDGVAMEFKLRWS